MGHVHTVDATAWCQNHATVCHLLIGCSTATTPTFAPPVYVTQSLTTWLSGVSIDVELRHWNYKPIKLNFEGEAVVVDNAMTVRGLLAGPDCAAASALNVVMGGEVAAVRLAS